MLQSSLCLFDRGELKIWVVIFPTQESPNCLWRWFLHKVSGFDGPQISRWWPAGMLFLDLLTIFQRGVNWIMGYFSFGVNLTQTTGHAEYNWNIPAVVCANRFMRLVVFFILNPPTFTSLSRNSCAECSTWERIGQNSSSFLWKMSTFHVRF